MARPPGSKNKTPQELIVDADMLKKKAELVELARKQAEFRKQRTTPTKNGK